MLFSTIGFTAPWLLLGLLALPLLWILLRAVPPAPIRRSFPGVALLLGLRDETAQADKTPWWLLLLRALVMACLIIGLAGPIVNPVPMEQTQSKLLVILEGSWADAEDWDAQQRAALDLVQQLGNPERPVMFLQLTAPEEDLVFSAASEAARAIRAAEPNAWLPKRKWQGQFEPLGDFDTHWLASPLDWPGRDQLVRELLRHGSVEVSMSRSSSIGLLPMRATAEGIEISALRMTAGAAQVVAVYIVGSDPSGVERRLQRADIEFAAQELRATTEVQLPLEMRNRISRLVVSGHRSAAAVRLTDDRIQRPEIAILTGETSDREGLILFAPDHYLTQALSPVADLIEGTLDDVILANPDTIILADVAKIGSKEALADWVAEGGTLVRFAGPRLAAAQFEARERDPLLPVKLRAGGRTIGGAMSWGAPKTLQSFEIDTPFYGLPTPDEVTVTAQVLAEPGPDLAPHVIARLSDGTPLVTRRQLGQGQVVLFHVTANTQWSNLPISGLFVAMLERLSVIGSAANFEPSSLAGSTWQLVQQLAGTGKLMHVDYRAGIAGDQLAQAAISPQTPAGLYQGKDRRWARNILSEDSQFSPALWPDEVRLLGQDLARSYRLGAWFLALALSVLVADVVASLWISRRLRGGVLAVLAGALLTSISPESASAQTPQDQAIAASRAVVLAYVETQDARQDEISHAGLLGLSQALFQRTSIEPAEPMGLSLTHDELSFFPFLYWPVTLGQQALSPEQLRKLNRYLKGGGMILFDTRDSNIARVGQTTKEGRVLQQLASRLNLPPLAPIAPDHVLTRSFYLLQDFPGRFAGGEIWVEAPQNSGVAVEGMPFRNLNDGVTPVVIGGNDWAAAWAVDDAGEPLLPVGRGMAGERQREIALRFGVNLIMHVLTGNYKSDQVHVPELLKRLGE